MEETMTASDWREVQHWLEPRVHSPEDDDDDDEDDEDEDFGELIVRGDIGGES